MRVLITGTTGWLGAELAKKLSTSEQPHEVYGLSRRPTKIDGVTSIQADIVNKKDMEELSRRQPAFDVVVHLAGAAGWCSLEQGIDINVGGTRNLLDACRKAGTTKFVIASSVAVTGTCTPDYPPKQLPITQDHGFVGSKWAYALSKQMVEDMTKFMSTSDPDGDYLLIRIGGVVTDPPSPLKHLETAIGEEVIIEAGTYVVEAEKHLAKTWVSSGTNFIRVPSHARRIISSRRHQRTKERRNVPRISIVVSQSLLKMHLIHNQSDTTFSLLHFPFSHLRFMPLLLCFDLEHNIVR